MLDLSNIADAVLLLPTEAAEKLHQLRRDRDDGRSILRGLVESGMACPAGNARCANAALDPDANLPAISD
jgi:hypothetical protein